MDLGCARFAQHLHHRLGGRAAHDRVVDHHQPLARHVVAQRVELATDADVARLLIRRNERTADVAVANEPLPVRGAGPQRVALGGGHAGLGHAHHHVGLDRRLRCQLLAHAPSRSVDLAAVEQGVGPGEVHELDQAQGGRHALAREGAQRPHAGGVDHDHLARLDLALERGTDDVERGRLRGEYPARAEAAQAQRAEPVRIADADDVAGVHHDEAERALQARQDAGEGALEVAPVGGLLGRIGLRDQLADEVAVARDGAGDHSRRLDERDRVREVPVVAECEAGVADLAVDRLRVVPLRRTGRRVPRVADAKVSFGRREAVLIEDVRDEAHVLGDLDPLAIGDGHARRFLASVLERAQPVEDEVGNGTPGGVNTEDPAGLTELRLLRHGLHDDIGKRPLGATRRDQSLPSVLPTPPSREPAVSAVPVSTPPTTL